MKAKVLINILKKRLIKNSAIAFVLAIIYFGSSYYETASGEQITTLTNEIATLNNQINSKQAEFTEAETNLKKFLNINKSDLPTKDGYAAGYLRVGEIITRLDELKRIYSFKKLDFTIDEIKQSSRTQATNFDSFENTINITFEGATDEYVVSFINDLNFLLPGYLEVTKLNISKNDDVTPKNIKKYSDSNFYFVNGIIKITWITLKSKV
jgi:hypothetical protein